MINIKYQIWFDIFRENVCFILDCVTAYDLLYLRVLYLNGNKINESSK